MCKKVYLQNYTHFPSHCGEAQNYTAAHFKLHVADLLFCMLYEAITQEYPCIFISSAYTRTSGDCPLFGVESQRIPHCTGEFKSKSSVHLRYEDRASLRGGILYPFVYQLLTRGHVGGVVTHWSPTSEVGRSDPGPYVGKLVVAY